MPEFKGNVKAIRTDVLVDKAAEELYPTWEKNREQWKQGGDHGYHYLGSAILFNRIGKAMGEAMLELLPEVTRHATLFLAKPRKRVASQSCSARDLRQRLAVIILKILAILEILAISNLWRIVFGMVRHQRSKIRDSDSVGSKYFDRLLPMLERLHDVGSQRDLAGNRTLFFYEQVRL